MYYGRIDPRMGRAYNLIDMTEEERVELQKKVWKKQMGTDLDLEHPRTFNEKLQWLKIYDRHPDMARCIDKVTFKDYVAEKLGGGYTAGLLRVWDSPEEVSFSGLPDRYAVKSNAQGNGCYIAVVSDPLGYDLAALEEEIKAYWFNPLNLHINGFDYTSRHLKPKVFVEEYIDLSASAEECKAFCFHGEPKFFQVYRDHFQDGRVTVPAIGHFTLDWEFMDVSVGNHPVQRDFPRPRHLDEMIRICKKLSGDFPFVRIDFYDTEEKLYLGEFTFHPNSGFKKYHPPAFDLWMGSMLHIDGCGSPCNEEEGSSCGN